GILPNGAQVAVKRLSERSSTLKGPRREDPCAWRGWKEGNGLQLVDPLFADETLEEEEVLRCIHIGLCCVQDQAAIRPTTDALVLMLTSPTVDIPEPSLPDYYYARFLSLGVGAAASSSSPIPDIDSTVPTKSTTINQITASVVDPR
ncbi:unnamed protein product, partial [Thlaspi arvense]